MSDPDPNALFEQFGDLFGDFFGGGRSSGTGPDVRLEVVLEPEDLACGTKRVTFDRFIGCTHCHGSGRERSASSPCLTCKGEGTRTHRQGGFEVRTTCADCRGSGSSRACAPCGGKGGDTHTETVKVTLPPGLRDGQTLRLRGKGGDRFAGGAPGHLYLALRIPSQRGYTIPVEESAHPTLGRPFWIGLVIAIVAAAVATLVLRR